MFVTKTSVVNQLRGFTLIELMVGIAILTASLLLMTAFLFPQAQNSLNPWFQVRSAELAQSIMNEILSRRYDENTNLNTAQRCGENGTTCIAALDQNCVGNAWREEGANANRAVFDDIDDYHCFDTINNSANVFRQLGNDNNIYDQYQFSIRVAYAGTDLGLANVQLAKRITVTITSELGDSVTYTTYKTNY